MKQLVLTMMLSVMLLESIAIADSSDWQFVVPYGNSGSQVILISEGVINKLLDTMTLPQQRQRFAEKWLQTLQQSMARNRKFQETYIILQKDNLNFQKEIEKLQVEKLKLQTEIEKLRTENLHLEKEKLELQLKLKETKKKEPAREKAQPEKGDVISGTGQISHIAIEGGFYGIVAADGNRYKPINLPKDFQKDGLQVRFKVKEKTEMVSFHMWGRIVELIKIEKL